MGVKRFHTERNSVLLIIVRKNPTLQTIESHVRMKILLHIPMLPLVTTLIYPYNSEFFQRLP